MYYITGMTTETQGQMDLNTGINTSQRKVIENSHEEKREVKFALQDGRRGN